MNIGNSVGWAVYKILDDKVGRGNNGGVEGDVGDEVGSNDDEGV